MHETKPFRIPAIINPVLIHALSLYVGRNKSHKTITLLTVTLTSLCLAGNELQHLPGDGVSSIPLVVAISRWSSFAQN